MEDKNKHVIDDAALIIYRSCSGVIYKKGNNMAQAPPSMREDAIPLANIVEYWMRYLRCGTEGSQVTGVRTDLRRMRSAISRARRPMTGVPDIKPISSRPSSFGDTN